MAFNFGPVKVTATRSAKSSIFERVTNAVTQRALDKAVAKIPDSARKHLPLARSFMNKGVTGLIDSGLNSLFDKLGIGGTLLPGGIGTGASQLLGGITMADAISVFDEHVRTDFAKKNLWCIRVRNLQGGAPLDINLFAIDVAYPLFSVQGDPVHVGSGSFDVVTNSERREMRITTLDDSSGSVKRWFEERHAAMCHPDGTFGLPVEYVFKVDVLHAYISEQVDGAIDGWVDSYVMRPGSLETDLSRREDAMQEVQMTFVQWDTFAALT